LKKQLPIANSTYILLFLEHVRSCYEIHNENHEMIHEIIWQWTLLWRWSLLRGGATHLLFVRFIFDSFFILLFFLIIKFLWFLFCTWQLIMKIEKLFNVNVANLDISINYHLDAMDFLSIIFGYVDMMCINHFEYKNDHVFYLLNVNLQSQCL
jgi:hypothetical protein